MLVLSRKIGEQILIGDDIRVTITKLSGNRASIAIDAPREVMIKRCELVQPDASHSCAASSQVQRGRGGDDDRRVARTDGVSAAI